MLKTIPYLVEHHGGSEVHLIWIDLFTAPCKFVTVEVSKQTPVDHFLQAFDYKPAQNKAIRREIEKSNGKEELEANLSRLFGFDKLPIVNLLVLSKTVCEMPNQSSQSKNLHLLPDFIFRGLVVLSHHLPDVVKQYLINPRSCSFPKEYWELLHFPLDFLFHHEVKDLSKVIKILDPFLSAFSSLSDIVGLPLDDPLRSSLVTVISSTIPYISIEWDTWTRKIWDFLLDTFHEIARQIGRDAKCDDLVCLWHGFIQLVQPYVKDLDIERCDALATVTALFLEGIAKFAPGFECKYFSFGIDSLSLIGGITHQLETETVVAIVKGAVAFVRWVMASHDINAELEDVPEEKQEERELVWSDWQSYFGRTELLPDILKVRFKNQFLMELVESLRSVFIEAPQLLTGMFEGLADAMSHLSKTEKMGICSVFCLALVSANAIPTSDFLQAFMFSTILSSSANDSESPRLLYRFKNIVLSMLFSFCRISSELLLFVLSTISMVIRGSECSKVHYFMPLFRSLLLVDSEINFTHHFFASGIVEDLQWVMKADGHENAMDETAELYQIMVITRPMEVFRTFTFLPILRDMAMKPRLQKILGPCFKIGMSLSLTPPSEDGREAVCMTLEQVVTIFRQCSIDLYLTDLCLTLVNYVAESIEIFDDGVMERVVKLSMFDAIASLPGIIKTSQSVITVVLFFTRLCGQHHDFRLSLENENSELIKKLETGIMMVPIDNPMVETLIGFMFNLFDQAVIANRSALRLLLKVIEGTGHEEHVLKTLHMLCRNDIANAYACFSCDVIGFIMNKLSDERLVSIGIPLFQVISSSFFSPLAMSETMKAMRLTENGKRLPKHQAILDCYLDLLKEKNRIPVSGFYHFNGATTGIFGPHVDPSLFNQPFTIVTAFKQESNISELSPIVAMCDKSSNCVVFVKNNLLTIRQSRNGEVTTMNTVQHQIRPNHWYTVMLIFNQNTLHVYLGNKPFDQMAITKLEFENDVNLLLGSFDVNKFVGDIGPTLFLRMTEPDAIAVRYAQFNSTRSNMRNVFIKYLPWSLEEGQVCDVVVDGDRAYLMGSAIPFCCTVAEVFQYDLSFERFIPLLLYVNHDEEGASDERSNERFFVTVLRILKCLLSMSGDMQNSFGEFGGFQLLAGFFAQINVRYFTIAVLDELREIFQSIADQALRGQMCEFIWLNFDLWSRMSYDLQLHLYTTTLYALWTDDKATGHDSFKSAPVDFVLYEIQKSSKLEGVVDSKLTFFPYDSGNAPSVENPFYELTPEEEKELKRVQWHLFGELLKDHDSPSIFLNVLLLAYGHESEVIRVLSTEVIDRYLMQSNRNVLIAMEMVDGYDFLLWVCDGNPFPVLKNVIFMMMLLVNQEKKGNFNPRGKSRDIAVASLAMKLFREQWPANTISLIEWCFNQTFDKQVGQGKTPAFKNPEFLTIVAAGCHCLDRAVVRKIVARIEESLIEHPESIIPLTKMVSWSLWLFRLLVHAFDLPEELASFCHTFVLILFELCKEKQFESFIQFFSLTHVIEHYCQVDLSSFISECLALMLTRSKIEDFSDESRLVLARASVARLLFSFKYHKELAPLDSSIAKIFDSIFEQVPRQKDEDWRSFGQAFDISTCKRRDADGKWADLSLATETLKILHSLWMGGTVPTFHSTAVQIPMHVAYVVISFMVLTEDVPEGIKKNIIASNDELASILTDESRKADIIEGLAQGMPARIQEEAIQFRMAYLPAFVDEVENLSWSLYEMVSQGSDKMKRAQYMESVEGFQKGYGKTRLLVCLHNHKLMTSFVREVTSNGGPWALTYTAVKWRCTTKFDGQGRNIFMSVNRSFDDHRKASAIRDSLEFTPDSADQVAEVIPFKRILEQKATFVPIGGNTKTATFRAKVNSLTKQFAGSLHVTQKAIVFDGVASGDGLGKALPPEQCERKFFEVPFSKIGFIFTRMYLHDDLNCELYTNTRKLYSLAFDSTQKRTDFLNAVKKNTEKVHLRPSRLFECFQRACGCCVQTIPSTELLVKSKIVKKWLKRRISTFQYLFYLNILSGRSFNDITQYPVYPWVLADYDSEKIDLDDPSVYRDFTKPVGAINEEKLESLKRIEADIDDWTQKCLYRTHYSNPAAVIGFLIRTEPFSTLHIQLQGNKYDHPERMFFSIGRAWKSITGKNLDFRELIPEFFCTPHFLTNENGFDLGQVGGRSISEVELPPWAKNAFEFVSIHRQALESEHVSLHIADWIDLIFGINQRSTEHNSLFHPFTYTDLVTASEFPEDSVILAKHYCANFGICPLRLFSLPHPRRTAQQIQPLSARDFPHMGKIVAATGNFMMTNECVLINLSDRTAASLSLKWKNYALCHLSAEHVLTVAYDGTSVHIFDVAANSESGILVHSSSIINCLEVIDSHYLITGGSDCGIYVWNVRGLDQICKIAVHSMPIVAIDGDGNLGVIASIDQGHNVYLTLLLTRHVLHMFTLKWPTHTTHKIKLFPSGMVVVTSHVTGETETALQFFDLCGHELGRIDLSGAVASMQVMGTDDFSEYLAVTTSHRAVFLINCTEMKIERKLDSPVVPEYLGYMGGRTFVVVRKKGENEYLAPVDF